MTQFGWATAVGCLTIAGFLAGGARAAVPACAPALPALVSELAIVFEAVSGRGAALEPTAAGRATEAGLRTASGCASGLARMKRHGTRGHPVAWDALAVVVHPENPHLTGIGVRELASVLAGGIVNWRQLGGEDSPLELQVLADAGTLSARLLARRLPGHPDAGIVAAGAHGSVAELARSVERNPNAIGVIALSEALAYDVRVLALEGVVPDRDSIRDGSYLLTMPVYVAYPRSGPERAHAEALIEFAHSQAGRQAIRKLGAVPYLEALHLADQRRHGPIPDTPATSRPGGIE